MEFIQQARGCGKTTKVVEWVRTTPNAVMIVVNEREKDRILKQFKFLHYNQVETWQTVINNYYRPTKLKKVFFIDNIDLILPMVFDATIMGVTINKHDATEQP